MVASKAGSHRSVRTSDKRLDPLPEWHHVRPDRPKIEPLFVGCKAEGCSTTSARAEYESMTLRTGFSTCTAHMDPDEINSRVTDAVTNLDDDKTTVIFYDLELTSDGQVEQLCAFADSGESFSVFLRTTVRTNTSKNLKMLPPVIYTALASEPMDAMRRFCNWIKMIHSMHTYGDTDPNNIILAAHFGSCHDHVYLLRTMMMWGIEPPQFRLSDTLTLFKVMLGMKKRANLRTLSATYAAWMQHLEHDADSDARVLRAVVMTVFPSVRKACYAFSISYKEFSERTGLNMHGVRPIYTFRNNSIYADPDLDSNADTDSSG